jgi:endonuclease/exonuclease/phosphatase family metal-dependent hydrolase
MEVAMYLKKISGYFFLIILVAAMITVISCKKQNTLEGLKTNALKCMTINVWSGLDYIGTFKMGEYESPEIREKRYQALLKEIAKYNPDIIAINEANFLPDYIQKLAKDINYDYIYHVGVAGLKVGRFGIPVNLKEGDAILARKGLQLHQVGHKQLSGGGIITNYFSFHTQDATQVLIGRVIVNAKPVYVAVTHWHASPMDTPHTRMLLKELQQKFGYTDAEYQDAIKKLEEDNTWRKNESKIMAEYCKAIVPEHAPFIVMGDFNATVDMPEMQYFLQQGFQDTFVQYKVADGYTWNPLKNCNIQKYYTIDTNKKFESLYTHVSKIHELEPKRIDYVIVNTSISPDKIINSKVCCDTIYNGIHVSDHFGVYAEIRID